MFLVSSHIHKNLLAHARDTNPRIACGLLLGEKRGSITQSVQIDNCAHNPSSDWQLDPRQLTDELTRALRDGLTLQGIYYTWRGELSAPTLPVIAHWHYN